VAVRALKRFVVDQADPSSFRPEVVPARADASRVAIIGAGPAGLTAAHLLSLEGHRVRLYERQPRPGGMLVCGIPEYRLPRALLEREIAALLNDNIELRCGESLGRDFTVDSLLADGFRAVYVAIGAHRSKRLDIAGEESAGVVPSIEFLTAHNLRGEGLAHGAVGVVGGGNSAIDAARVAVRQPGVAKVTIFYRRTRAEMPAYADEIDAALEEGIELRTLVSPLRIEATDGRLRAAVFQRNELGEPDAGGRRRPVPVAGSEERVALDTLVAAIGEEPDRRALDGLPLTRWGTLSVSSASGATSRPGVFAGGDVATGPGTLVDAVAAGKRAAVMIARYLGGKQLRERPRVLLPCVYVPPVGAEGAEDDAAPRPRPRHLDAADRKGFCEVELALRPAEALREARRCLRCDLDFTQP
jgi:NADPH-dependent glutamate synthase beta subunit-like oxidoreductase